MKHVPAETTITDTTCCVIDLARNGEVCGDSAVVHPHNFSEIPLCNRHHENSLKYKKDIRAATKARTRARMSS